jgi:hypothetical protein
MRRSRTYILGFGVAALVGAAQIGAAQSYNSFHATDGIYGVVVTQSGLDYTVSVEANPYLMIGGLEYDITDVFGFWSLSANNALDASGAGQHNWSWNESSSSGYIAGWNDPSKKDDIQPGGSLDFTYDTLNQSSVENYGFHFSLVQAFQGSNTAYFSVNPSPEPVSLGALALGSLALIRRRRRS